MRDDADEAARLLRSVEEERDRIRHRTSTDERLIYLVLAAAYLLGFGGQFLSLISGDPLAAVSWIAVAVVGALAVGAIFWHTAHQYRGIRGPATRHPMLHGLAWLIALGTTVAMMYLAATWFPTGDIRQVALVVSSLAAGLMYIALGHALRNRVERNLGRWLTICGIMVAFLPMPAGILVLALLGSAGFVLAWYWTGPSAQRTEPRELSC